MHTGKDRASEKVNRTIDIATSSGKPGPPTQFMGEIGLFFLRNFGMYNVSLLAPELMWNEQFAQGVWWGGSLVVYPQKGFDECSEGGEAGYDPGCARSAEKILGE